MELFRLFGTILVDNEKANKSISKTESQAKGSSDGMASAFKKVGTALAAAFYYASPLGASLGIKTSSVILGWEKPGKSVLFRHFHRSCPPGYT